MQPSFFLSTICLLVLSIGLNANLEDLLVNDESKMWTTEIIDGEHYYIVPTAVCKTFLDLQNQKYSSSDSLGVRLTGKRYKAMYKLSSQHNNEHGELNRLVIAILKNSYGQIEAMRYAIWLVENCPGIKFISLDMYCQAFCVNKYIPTLFYRSGKRCLIQEKDRNFFTNHLKCTILDDETWEELKQTISSYLNPDCSCDEIIEFINQCLLAGNKKSFTCVKWLLQIAPAIKIIPEQTLELAEVAGGLEFVNELKTLGKPIAQS